MDQNLRHQKIKFPAAFFETKGVTLATAGTTAFEFVIINSPSLAKRWESGADGSDFASHFHNETNNGCDVTWFYNLGGDARLVCPKPPPPEANPLLPTGSNTNEVDHQDHPAYYAHLLPFLRSAPTRQVSALWRLVAQQYMSALIGSGKAVWLSTSGEGVAWLHFRLDDRPKYIQYNPFAGVDGDEDDEEMSE